MKNFSMDPKDTSRQVLEVTKTSGFQTLAGEMDEEIKLTEELIEEDHKRMPEYAEKGIDSQKVMVKLVSRSAYLKGLKHFKQLIEDHRAVVDKG